ncbi:zinc finger protein 131-like isoform X2 [Chiloscyllium plagiosum]|uniref:zinc finger protein 131-like isoform X2 n=1 Tax=Chiloscyllium plagiosum TaxID=36176 RepID=UPI001CB7DE26|nr:zinc finger protein 131-like isoform X2 [Chiloscyllium plagiosum]
MEATMKGTTNVCYFNLHIYWTNQMGKDNWKLSEMEAEEVLVDHVHEVPSHYKVVLDRLNEQRQQEQFTDITLIVDGHHFKAHKAVLAACSQFFCRFFQDFREEPLVEIEGELS